MTVQKHIYDACEVIGTNPPKVAEYANGFATIFRNGEGQKVCVMIGLTESADSIKTKIATAYKIKPQNIATEATLDKVFPRKAIQEYQEAKKHEQLPDVPTLAEPDIGDAGVMLAPDNMPDQKPIQPGKAKHSGKINRSDKSE